MGNRVVGVAIGGAKLHRYAAVALLDGQENQWQSLAANWLDDLLLDQTQERRL
jgi:hypothetical protein